MTVCAINSFAIAQTEDDVIINEFVVNPATGKEYVELLVVGNNVNLQGWTLSDVSTRTGNSATTEGDFTFPSSASYLASVPRGTYIVIEFSTPSANASTLFEDISLSDSTSRKLIILPTTTGVTLSGVIDNATSDNIQLYAGSRALGTIVDQVLCGTNTSYLAGATWGDNSSTTTTDNVNAGVSLPSGSAFRFVPAVQDLSGFRANDTGGVFILTATSYGSPGMTNFGVNDFNGSLPVQFKSFTATKSDDAIHLKWSTASENNNKGFELQRSINGAKYQAVGFIKGAGNSNITKTYSFTDVHGLTGNICYRLKQIDFDGASAYSKVTCVNIETVKTTEVITTPNPFNTNLNIKYNSLNEGSANMQIIDMLGNSHQNTNMSVNKGENTLTLDTEALPLGIYFIRITNGTDVKTQRIVKR